MNHQLIPPPAALKNHVRYFWTMEDDATDEHSKTFHTLVDDSSGIIIQHNNGNSAFRTAGETTLHSNFLYGQSTRPTTTFSTGPFSIVGVHFHPQAIKTLLGIDAHHMKDQMVELDLLGYTGITEQVFNAGSVTEGIGILSDFLTTRLTDHTQEHDHIVSNCINRIRTSGGQVNIAQLVRECSLSERQLERRFKTAVGVSPKFYARTIRFRTALQLMQQKKFTKLSDIAFELNYADQAHFIRDIRDFSGYTPRSLAQDVNELILNLHLG
jgi:AraC-like DNA-binding protein